MGEELDWDFMEEEIKVVFKQIHPTKAPWLDGMPPQFYQCYWHIVGPSITTTLIQTLNLGQFPSKLNHTFITLIPKKKQPSCVADYHRISFCNILYKLISKVIANRLSLILPHVIFDFQSAFVPERQITDNILVAYEIFYFLRRKTKGKHGYMSFKLDMSKAYERVEWGYLKRTLKVLGFPQRLIQLIMLCVESTTFSVIVNGVPTGHIIPSRGLWQGDPLSPYLFLLCIEGLISLLQKSANNSGLQGIQVCRGALIINHLLFTDDSLIICKARKSDFEQLLQILHKYERAWDNSLIWKKPK